MKSEAQESKRLWHHSQPLTPRRKKNLLAHFIFCTMKPYRLKLRAKTLAEKKFLTCEGCLVESCAKGCSFGPTAWRPRKVLEHLHATTPRLLKLLLHILIVKFHQEVLDQSNLDFVGQNHLQTPYLMGSEFSFEGGLDQVARRPLFPSSENNGDSWNNHALDTIPSPMHRCWQTG